MNNKELILSITDLDKSKRLDKILSHLHINYVKQCTNVITNIIIPAKKQEGKLSILAHYDTFPGSLGYNDNSTGVITLLKLQDHLKDNIELVFTDFEEEGGLGCKEYLNGWKHPKSAINVDVIGLGDTIFYEEYVGKVSFKIPENMENYRNIPFSDSHILRDYNIPNILVLTGPNREKLVERVFEHQHCNKNDDNLDLLSEDMMNQVFETIKEMIKG